jgi:hypothetical protein
MSLSHAAFYSGGSSGVLGIDRQCKGNQHNPDRRCTKGFACRFHCFLHCAPVKSAPSDSAPHGAELDSAGVDGAPIHPLAKQLYDKKSLRKHNFTQATPDK